jgi:hypothetical protein
LSSTSAALEVSFPDSTSFANSASISVAQTTTNRVVREEKVCHAL